MNTNILRIHQEIRHVKKRKDYTSFDRGQLVIFHREKGKIYRETAQLLISMLISR